MCFEISLGNLGTVICRRKSIGATQERMKHLAHSKFEKLVQRTGADDKKRTDFCALSHVFFSLSLSP